MENPRITSVSTDQIYKADILDQNNQYKYNETYADIRKELNSLYHSNYTIERQILQDKIITELVSVGRSIERPWLVYVAGAIGAGKTYTIRKFSEKHFFPLIAFVVIDLDRIKCMLPDMEKFIENDPDTASNRVHKEACLIAEIIERQAIKLNKCILIDGFIRDLQWYQKRIGTDSLDHPNYLFALIHVVAPSELIYDRLEKRTIKTGRNIPLITTEKSIEEIPEFVKELSGSVHFTVTINNDEDEMPTIIEPPMKMLDGHKYKWFINRFENVWKELDKKSKDENEDELKNRLKIFDKDGCSMRVGGGYYGKYLKYKMKYLALKKLNI